jgi:hypothetical protein
MLDYAANGVMYWPLERLRSTFEANCKTQGRGPEAALRGSFGLELNPDEFWQKATTNLQAGKVRLIFVADKIPAELRRIVEFLNQQMNLAEVFAVEIKQHVAEHFKAFVPRLIGQTAQAQRTKSVGASRPLDEEYFFEALESNRSSNEAATAAKILEWAKINEFSINWGSASLTLGLNHAGQRHQVVGVYTDGSLEIKFAYIQWKAPFDEEAKRLALRDRLNEVTGMQIQTAEVTDKRPSYSLSVLQGKTDRERFLAALDWFVGEVRASGPPAS